MTLTPATRLGSYEILSLIGSGGMGEVYRAKDTKLNRDVALKILPSEFALDPARNGRELFFRSGTEMMVSDIAASPNFAASRPRVLFRAPFAASATYANYDVSPDGQQFVMVNSGEQEAASSQIGVLMNWTEELKRLVPTK